jgi:hypothetical protein
VEIRILEIHRYCPVSWLERHCYRSCCFHFEVRYM